MCDPEMGLMGKIRARQWGSDAGTLKSGRVFFSRKIGSVAGENGGKGARNRAGETAGRKSDIGVAKLSSLGAGFQSD